MLKEDLLPEGALSSYFVFSWARKSELKSRRRQSKMLFPHEVTE
jgi:hypothetical protein